MSPRATDLGVDLELLTSAPDRGFLAVVRSPQRMFRRIGLTPTGPARQVRRAWRRGWSAQFVVVELVPVDLAQTLDPHDLPVPAEVPATPSGGPS